jgi:Protochlamydia outer membrane protein
MRSTTLTGIHGELAALRGRRGVVLALVGLALPAAPGAAQRPPTAPRLVVDAWAGARTSRLFWSIGTSRAERLSELTYDDVAVREFRISARYRFAPGRGGPVAGAEVGRGTVGDGSIRDSDYRGDNESWRSAADVTGNVTTSASVAVGWEWTVTGGRLEGVTTWLGATRDEQTLRMQNGVQVVPDPSQVVGLPLTGLDSRYLARWTGPWVAAEPALHLGPGRLSALVRVDLRTDYYGEGSWNLRPELAQPVSFRQVGSGWGVQASARYGIAVPGGLALFLAAQVVRRSAGDGTDTTFRADGGTTGLTLRHVVGTSAGVGVGVEKRF